MSQNNHNNNGDGDDLMMIPPMISPSMDALDLSDLPSPPKVEELDDIPLPTNSSMEGIGISNLPGLPTPKVEDLTFDGLGDFGSIPAPSALQQPPSQIPQFSQSNAIAYTGKFGDKSPTSSSNSNFFPGFNVNDGGLKAEDNGDEPFWLRPMSPSASASAYGIGTGGMGQIHRGFNGPSKWNNTKGLAMPNVSGGTPPAVAEQGMIVPFGAGNNSVIPKQPLSSQVSLDIDMADGPKITSLDDEDEVKALEYATWDDKEMKGSLSNLPERFEDLTDYQLAFIDRVDLKRLMDKANLSDKQMQAVKIKRRKLKNRQSAKAAVGKKKRQFQGLAAANNYLSSTVEKLKRQNAHLMGRNEQLEQSFQKAAQIAAQATQEKSFYEQEIRRLTALVSQMSSGGDDNMGGGSLPLTNGESPMGPVITEVEEPHNDIPEAN